MTFYHLVFYLMITERGNFVKKNMKKFFVTILVLVTIFTSTFLHYENTKALGLEIALGAGIVIFVGGCCVACDILVNPDKYKDLQESMKDFGNATLENQKRLYEIEKANFEMVMQKAVDAGVGSCIVGSDGKLYSAAQLQSQEYPSFDTWKGYKEKESEKPKKSLWDKFKLLEPFAGLLCDLFPDSSTGGFSDAEDEQLYYTGDDGYMDEDGNFTIRFKCRNVHYVDAGDSYAARNDNSIVAYDNYSFTASGTFPTTKYRIWGVVSPGFKNYYNEYNEKGKYSVLFRGYGQVGITYYSGSGSYKSFLTSLGIADSYEFKHTIYNSSTCEYETGNSTYMYMSFQLLDGEPNVYLYDYLSTNIPVFDSFVHGQQYYSTGSLEGLINGAPQESTPTPQPTSLPHIGPVHQYTNYFSTNFSPSVMPYYVNYNIVNNYNYGDEFDINNYTGKDELTPTPEPTERIPLPTLSGDDSSDGDTLVTNNILIIQTNILNNISDTVTNIYNFFQIDVDVIQQEMEYHFEDNPTGFDQLKKAYSAFETAFPSDKIMEGSMSGELDLYYPKITIKVPKALDRFLESGDDKIIMEDGLKKIVLCDFKDYAIHFVRFRKFLEIVLRIGLIFFILRELSVMFSIS